jgi:hypothetical protein
MGVNGFIGAALKSPSTTEVGYESYSIYLTPKGCYKVMSGASEKIYFKSWSDIIGTSTLGKDSTIKEQ